jgi:tetratricopeptide (TPR) repeat protein
MKAERRHELQENQLAAWLSGKYVDARPYLTAAVAIVAGVALIWFVWSWYSRSTTSAQNEVWNSYYQAANESNTGDDSPLREFISEHSNEPVGIAARERLAIMQMGKGADAQLYSRDASMAAYQEAIELFDEVHELTEDESLKRFASFQIALCHESRYDLDAAIKSYEEIVERYAGTASADRAIQRLEDLKNPATKDFYAWHRVVNPAATTPAAPSVPIEPATNLDDLPDAPPADPMPPADPLATDAPVTDPAAPKDPATPENPMPPTNPPESTPPATTPPATDPIPPADAPAEGEPKVENPGGDQPAADADGNESPPPG